MSRKGKSHEINDIIDTAFTETDYSHGNGFYDEIRDYNRPRNTGGFRSLTQTQTQTQTQTTSDTKTEKNMFLKYSQNDTSVKNNDTQNEKQIVVDDDNFPSLGGAKPKTPASTAPAKQPVSLNFKKIVTTPLAIPTESANANANSNSNVNTKEQSSSRNSYHNKSKGFLMYHHIKDNSEKIARYRMENDYSSEDDY